MVVGTGADKDTEVVKKFSFDRVAGPDASQAAFFDLCGVAGLVDSALEGFNVSVLAYGQTGSGKRFTQ